MKPNEGPEAWQTLRRILPERIVYAMLFLLMKGAEVEEVLETAGVYSKLPRRKAVRVHAALTEAHAQLRAIVN